MSNNPGKRGKPAPWVIRERKERDRAFREYQLANHPAFAEWSKRRLEAFKSFMPEEGRTFGPGYSKALNAAHKRLRAWEKKNPNPMSWDDYTRLEAEFAAQYMPKDYS